MSVSDNVLKDSKIDHLEKEAIQSRNVIKNISGQWRAQKQAIEEFLNSNINLRASILLLEEDAKIASTNIVNYLERIKALEEENKILHEKAKQDDSLKNINDAIVLNNCA